MGTDKNALLRSIPKADRLLSLPEIRRTDAPHALLLEALREELEDLRRVVLDGGTLPDEASICEGIKRRAMKKKSRSLVRVINATGVILHTNLGRARLSQAAAEAVCEAALNYSTLEYDLASGKRGSRHDHVKDILCRLTGAEDAMVVNNNASAVMLMLTAVAKGKEVVVSRGELVEIGGSFRVPAIMEQSGAFLREVGTTNKTKGSDYEAVITRDDTAAVLKVHTSNFRIMGFTESASTQELAQVSHKHGIPLLYDIGSGSLIDLAQFGLTGEPTVQESLIAGADVVTFSGDKLLGGPQAGIIVGKREYIERMKKEQLARAIRVDKLTLAALEATLISYLDPEDAKKTIPTLRMLSEDVHDVVARAQALQQAIGDACSTKTEMTEAEVGGGSVPMQSIKSCAVALNAHISEAELEKRLREQSPAVIGRLEKGRLLLDMKAVGEDEIPLVANAVKRALMGGV